MWSRAVERIRSYSRTCSLPTAMAMASRACCAERHQHSRLSAVPTLAGECPRRCACRQTPCLSTGYFTQSDPGFPDSSACGGSGKMPTADGLPGWSAYRSCAAAGILRRPSRVPPGGALVAIDGAMSAGRAATAGDLCACHGAPCPGWRHPARRRAPDLRIPDCFLSFSQCTLGPEAAGSHPRLSAPGLRLPCAESLAEDHGRR